MKYGPNDFQLTPIQTCGERIKQLRKQMVVHSYIYYEMNQNILSDALFDERAYELVDLQTTYPYVSLSVPYELGAFMDFDGSTGFNLPFKNAKVAALAEQLMKQHALS